MSDVWFTSDLHLGHRRVAELRGFADPAEHDAAVEDGIRSVVAADDILWILGDLALTSSPARTLATIGAWPGRKMLVLGNHDAAHPQMRRARRDFRKFLYVFEWVGTAAQIRDGKDRVMLSHYPYDGDSRGEGDRDVQWRLRDEGAPVVHGHTHSGQVFTRSLRGTPQVHVGLDAWGLGPVSGDDVWSLIRGSGPSSV